MVQCSQPDRWRDVILMLWVLTDSFWVFIAIFVDWAVQASAHNQDSFQSPSFLGY